MFGSVRCARRLKQLRNINEPNLFIKISEKSTEPSLGRIQLT